MAAASTPAAGSGFECVVPMEIQEQGSVHMDAARLRFTWQEDEDCFLIVLQSEANVFVNFASKITRDAFDQLRRDQQLVIGFDGLPAALKKLLSACVVERKANAALLVRDSADPLRASLHIVCKSDVRIIELLVLPFQQLGQAQNEEMVQKRFQELCARVEAAEARLHELSSFSRRSVNQNKVPALLLRTPGTPSSTSIGSPGAR